jgi:hypothetical protein
VKEGTIVPRSHAAGNATVLPVALASNRAKHDEFAGKRVSTAPRTRGRSAPGRGMEPAEGSSGVVDGVAASSRTLCGATSLG